VEDIPISNHPHQDVGDRVIYSGVKYIAEYGPGTVFRDKSHKNILAVKNSKLRMILQVVHALLSMLFSLANRWSQTNTIASAPFRPFLSAPEPFSRTCSSRAMKTSLQKAYTAAIALNNMGVSLLERRCYRQAMEAFSDAMTVMREISMLHKEPSNMVYKRPSLRPSYTNDAKLQKAIYNLAHCQRDVDPDHKSDSHINFCVLTERGCTAVIGSALQDESIFKSSTTFLIRVELERKSIHDCLDRDRAFESAIILHNLGNAYKCLASVATSASTAKKNLESSLKIFELSYSVLQNEWSPELDQELSSQVLHISILVLRSITIFAALREGMGRRDLLLKSKSHLPNQCPLQQRLLRK
jgi:hypothetical protein